MSLDALRGFDMFWIIGADALVYALHRMTQTPGTGFLADQLEHADWEGFHFYDLIFPLFIFIAGVSLVFSLSRELDRAGRAGALARVLRRGALLYLLGIFYYGGLSHVWPDMRLVGVLNRIALAYAFTGVLFCFFRPRALAAIGVAILVSYWALLSFTPIRDIQLTKSNLAALAEQSGDFRTAALFKDPSNPSAVKESPAWAAAEKMFFSTTNRVAGKFGKGYNLADHLDFQYLPGRKYDTFFDPEGLLSTLPAVGTCLLGVFAGLLLRSGRIPDRSKVGYLLGAGFCLAVLGWLWSFQFPVIKKIWTSSYVLVAGGYSLMLLAGFYYVIDVLRFQRWCRPFVWMGMNSITIYLASNLLGDELAARFAGGNVRLWIERQVGQGAGDLVLALVSLALAFLFVRYLYRKGIFLRL